MSHEQQNMPPAVSRAALRWRQIAAAYDRFNLLTHHLAGFVLKTLIVAYFLFCGLFLTLRYVLLPNIDHYKHNVEQIASNTVGTPISIGRIAASWHGLQPRLTLTGVIVHDKRNLPALSLPGVVATLSWRSLLVGTLRLDTLEIDRPDLQIERDVQGNLFVAGIPIDVKAENGGAG